MKKIRIRLLATGVALTIIAIILVYIQNQFQLTLFIFGMATKSVVSIMAILAIIAFVICFILKLMQWRAACLKYKWVCTALSVVLGLVGSILCLYSLLVGFINEPVYYTLISPDGRHEVVIEEESFLLAGYGSFYEKVNPLFMKEIGDYSTDDGFRPFENNAYSVEWLGDGLNINYSFGSGDGTYQNERLSYIK